MVSGGFDKDNRKENWKYHLSLGLEFRASVDKHGDTATMSS